MWTLHLKVEADKLAGAGLGGLHDGRRPAYITKEKIGVFTKRSSYEILMNCRFWERTIKETISFRSSLLRKTKSTVCC